MSALSVRTVLCICIGNITLLGHAYAEPWGYQGSQPAQLSYNFVRQLINSGITDEYGNLTHYDPTTLNKKVVSEAEWNEMSDKQRTAYLNEVKRQHKLYNTPAGQKYLEDRRAAHAAKLEELKKEIKKEKDAEWERQESERLAANMPKYEEEKRKQAAASDKTQAENQAASMEVAKNLTQSFLGGENEIREFLRWRYGAKLNFLDAQVEDFRKNYEQFLGQRFSVYNFSPASSYNLSVFLTDMARYAVLKSYFMSVSNDDVQAINSKLYNPERYSIVNADEYSRKFLFPEAIDTVLYRKINEGAKDWMEYQQRYLDGFNEMKKIDLIKAFASAEEKAAVRKNIESRFPGLFGLINAQDEWLRETHDNQTSDPFYNDFKRQTKRLFIWANKQIRYILGNNNTLTSHEKSEFAELLVKLGVVTGDARTAPLNPLNILKAINKDTLGKNLTDDEAKILDLIDKSGAEFPKNFILKNEVSERSLFSQRRILQQLVVPSLKTSGNICAKFYNN